MEKKSIIFKNEMTIGKAIYEKLGITPPNISDSEKLRQVMAWYPNKRFYKVKSAKSGKDIITVYPENTTIPIYSHDEWFAQDFPVPFLEINFERSFFEQFKELQQLAPVVALLSSQHENSEYCQDVEGIKNCYICFDSTYCENNYYCCRTHNSRSCVDCYSIDRSELLYDCTHMEDCYNTKWSFLCKDVRDAHFLFNCRNTSNSFMCSNLRNKEYCVYNVQKTKEEYEAFMQTVDTSDYAGMMKYKEQFRKELIQKTPVPPSFVEVCENATGNYIKNASDCDSIFESFNIKNAFNCFQAWDGHDVVDSYMIGLGGELIYQSVATGIEVNRAICCAFVWHSSNMEYCYLCLDCKECFGCIGLKNKSFCIFNKQYSEKEYRVQKEKLVNVMKAKSLYGIFFPLELSPFTYEDTIAYDFFENNAKTAFDLELATVHGVQTLDKNAVQICPLSGAKFKYTPHETHFYETHKIPFPRIAFPLRYAQRLELMDTGFTPKKVISATSDTALITYFAHPEKWKIVSEQEYLASLQ